MLQKLGSCDIGRDSWLANFGLFLILIEICTQKYAEYELQLDPCLWRLQLICAHGNGCRHRD